jgi:uncharacterized membrane protein
MNTFKIVLIAIVVLAAVGIFDSTYLSLEHLGGPSVACPAIVGNDCNVVTSSEYSRVFGIPVAFAGMAYYLTLFFLGMSLFGGFAGAKKLLVLVSGLGLLSSLWFTYLQFFVINALCFYCLISACITLFVFILSLYLLTLHNEPNLPMKMDSDGNG